ncbi:MAG: hypothetical protein ABIM30_09220 [candidate division WOR-3 bacterium]
MTTKTLDDVLRRVMNDPDIFSPPCDKETRAALPLLFEKDEWKKLKEAFEKRDKDYFNSIVEKRCRELQEKEQNARDWRKNQISNLVRLGDSLKKAYDQKPFFMKEMFDMLDSFGIIECKLPNMEDYGKVIENHNRSTVEHFFLYKIDKAKDDQKRALRKVLEYLKELYAMNLDVLEIAFFIRKLNSLTEFMEVIKDE